MFLRRDSVHLLQFLIIGRLMDFDIQQKDPLEGGLIIQMDEAGSVFNKKNRNRSDQIMIAGINRKLGAVLNV